MLAPKRYIPNLKNFSTFPFFNMRVMDMKAWQLYLGQSTFVVVMGIIFFLLMELIKALGLGNQPVITAGIGGLKTLTTGAVDESTGEELVAGIMPA